jgi:hypothetical protein
MMLENLTQTAVANGTIAPPELTEEQLRLLARIKRAVRRKTNSGVQKLAVHQRGEAVVISGACTSFYCKQLAQATAMSLLKSGEQLLNEIEVSPAPH